MGANVTFTGNVGRDPETRSFDNGRSLTTFSVGVSQGYYDQQNQWHDQGTMWITVECSPTAARQLPYVHKGVRLLVNGRLSQRFYQKKDGSQGSELRVYADAIGFLHKKDEQPQTGGFTGGQPQQPASDPWAAPQSDTEPEF